MSWKTPPPPLSPHKVAKTKQQLSSDSCVQNSDRFDNNNMSPAKKLPNTSMTTRKSNYGKYCLPTTQMSDPCFYSSRRNPKSPKSPNQNFDFEMSSTSHFSRSPLKSNNARFYENNSVASDSAPATLSSPMKKYEYNIVSSSPTSSSTSSSCNSAGEFSLLIVWSLKIPI